MQQNQEESYNIQGLLSKIDTYNKNIKNNIEDIDLKYMIDDVFNWCQVLAAKMDPLYGNNKNGEPILLTQDVKSNLIDVYKNLNEATQNVIKTKPQAKNDKAFVEMTQYIDNLITKDIQAVVNAKNDVSLPDTIRNGRSVQAHLNSADCKKTGNSMNTRIIYEKGGKNYVFTQNNYFDPDKTLNKLSDKYLKGYPEYADFFKKMMKFENYKDLTDNTTLYNLNSNKIVLPLNYIENQNPPAYNAIVKSGAVKEYQKFSKDPNFYAVFLNFCEDARNTTFSIQYNNNYMHIQKDEPINDRNNAMSAIASLFNQDQLIVHSEPAKIELDGNIIEGNVMNFADGADLHTAKVDDPLYNLELKDVDTPEAKKSICDLQVIDYICANMDRHHENLFYKIDENNKLIGIQGIDNDSSFNTKGEKYYRKGQNFSVGYGNMTVISESMANLICNTPASMVDIILKGSKMSEKAHDMAVERFNVLKGMLIDVDRARKVKKFDDIRMNNENCTPDDAVINIIPDDKWDQFPIDSLAGLDFRRPKHNLFQTVAKVPNITKKRKTHYFNELRDYQKPKMDLHAAMKGNAYIFNDFDKLIDANNSKIRGSSPQYEAVITELANFMKYQKTINFDNHTKNVDEFKEKLESLKQTVDTYVNKKYEDKKKKEFNTYTKNRVHTMERFSEFIRNTLINVTDLNSKFEDGRTRVNEKIDYLKAQKVKPMDNNEELKKDVSMEQNNEISTSRINNPSINNPNKNKDLTNNH